MRVYYKSRFFTFRLQKREKCREKIQLQQNSLHGHCIATKEIKIAIKERNGLHENARELTVYCKNGETEHGIRADCLGKRLQQRYQVRDHAQVFHFQAIVLRCSKECKEWNGLTMTGMLSKGFSFLSYMVLTYISPCGAEGPDTPYIRWRSPEIAGAELPFVDPWPRDRALEISAQDETRSVKRRLPPESAQDFTAN